MRLDTYPEAKGEDATAIASPVKNSEASYSLLVGSARMRDSRVDFESQCRMTFMEDDTHGLVPHGGRAKVDTMTHA